jgi:hypothetical protein
MTPTHGAGTLERVQDETGLPPRGPKLPPREPKLPPGA